MVMTVVMFMFAVVLIGVLVVIPVPVVMLMVVSMLAFVLMTTMVCMGLLVLVLMLMLVRMHCFMKLVVDHLERYRIDDRKNACGHCSVKRSRLDRGCGNAIAKQCHGFIERCCSSRV